VGFLACDVVKNVGFVTFSLAGTCFEFAMAEMRRGKEEVVALKVMMVDGNSEKRTRRRGRRRRRRRR
jgi:hypothetical protein